MLADARRNRTANELPATTAQARAKLGQRLGPTAQSAGLGRARRARSARSPLGDRTPPALTKEAIKSLRKEQVQGLSRRQPAAASGALRCESDRCSSPERSSLARPAAPARQLPGGRISRHRRQRPCRPARRRPRRPSNRRARAPRLQAGRRSPSPRSTSSSTSQSSGRPPGRRSRSSSTTRSRSRTTSRSTPTVRPATRVGEIFAGARPAIPHDQCTRAGHLLLPAVTSIPP